MTEDDHTYLKAFIEGFVVGKGGHASTHQIAAAIAENFGVALLAAQLVIENGLWQITFPKKEGAS